MSETVLVEKSEINDFIMRLMQQAGCRTADAQELSDVLVNADYRGHFSHGLNRLEMYFNDIRTGASASDQTCEILSDKGATAWVDGKNLLGPVVSKFSMELAIKKAKEIGVGWVCAKNSNHFSIAGHWSLMAEKEGLIGMAFTNTSPLVYPTRGSEPTYGTNPIACAAPASNGDCFALDMATTTVALGKIELENRKGNQMPNGWGADSDGIMTKDPKECLNGGGLLPLGGMENTGGYKGYGLGLMVEIFCGILSGSNYSSKVRRWGTTETAANLGQCFVAIDPSCFAPGFTGRLDDLHKIHRETKPSPNSDGPVLIPGDPERNHIEKCDSLGGIPYHKNVVDYMNNLAVKNDVLPMKFKTLI